MGDLFKTSFYITEEIKELIRKVSFYEKKTKTDVVCKHLKDSLSETLKKYEDIK